MAGKSPVTASDEQRAGLLALAGSRDRSEADRARAVPLTLAGWTSSKIAEAFGVREDTVRLWQQRLHQQAVSQRAHQHRARPAFRGRVKPPCASSPPCWKKPVADRRNWTILAFAPRSKREGVRISRSQRCPRPLAKKVPLAAALYAEGTSDGKRGGTGWACACNCANRQAVRSGRHCSSLRR